MGIVQAPSVLPGQVGVIGALKYMVTTDNFSAITTAGYLNNIDLAVNPILASDVLGVTYGYSTVTNSGTFSIFTPSISNGVITLVQAAATGVTLPTIANHIATYTNTVGNLSEDPATAISGGNIQAGLSGTAGTVASFPGTASKGSLVLAAVANTGNTVTTISNAAMGQASVISIPDPGAATADFAVAPAALVNNNLVKASGTAGLIADSGISSASISSAITQLGTIQQATVTFTPAQMVTAYDTPLTIIAAPGSGKMLQVISAAVYTASTGNTPYATGTAPIIQYGTAAHGAGTSAVGAGLVAGDITAATSQVRTLGPAASTAWTGTTNVPITFSNATGDYTAGTGTNVTFTLTYVTLTATV